MDKDLAVNNCRVNAVYDALQDTKKEKVARAEEVAEKRKQLEAKLEEVCAKYMTAYGQCDVTKWEVRKMTSKVENLEVAMKRFEMTDDALKRKRQELEQKLKTIIEKRYTEVEKFEEQLGCLKNNFEEARSYYTREVLNKDCHSLDLKIDSINKEVPALKQEVQTLTEEKNKIIVEGQFEPIAHDDFDIATLALKMTEEENRVSETCLEELKATLKNLQLKVDSFA